MKKTLPELHATMRLCERLNDMDSADEVVRYAARLVQHGFYTASQMFLAFQRNARACHALLAPDAVLHLKRRAVDQDPAHLETAVAVADATRQQTWMGAVKLALADTENPRTRPMLLAWCRDEDEWVVWMVHTTSMPDGMDAVSLPAGGRDGDGGGGRYVRWVTHDAVRPREPRTWATGLDDDDSDRDDTEVSYVTVSALNCYGVNFPSNWSDLSAKERRKALALDVPARPKAPCECP